MEEIEIVEWFEEHWPNFPKDKIWEASARGKTFFHLAFEVGGLKILLSAVIGERGGLSERIAVIDPSPQITIKRLIVAQRNYMNPLLLNLTEMRAQIFADRGLDVICRDSLTGVLKRARDYPEFTARTLRSDALETNVSVKAFVGGSPGWGKRS